MSFVTSLGAGGQAGVLAQIKQSVRDGVSGQIESLSVDGHISKSRVAGLAAKMLIVRQVDTIVHRRLGDGLAAQVARRSADILVLGALCYAEQAWRSHGEARHGEAGHRATHSGEGHEAEKQQHRPPAAPATSAPASARHHESASASASASAAPAGSRATADHRDDNDTWTLTAADEELLASGAGGVLAGAAR